MSLSSWAGNGWLKPHATSDQEIAQLMRIVDRELKDSAVTQISNDARLGMLYNAGLKLADIALRSAGYRAAPGGMNHYRTIMSLPLTMGRGFENAADYLDTTRQLRNRADYESVGFATDGQLSELKDVVEKLRAAVASTLRGTALPP